MDEHPIRAFRIRNGLKLAEAAGQIGISTASLSRIENGRQSASDELKRRITSWSRGNITANDLVNYVPGTAA